VVKPRKKGLGKGLGALISVTPEKDKPAPPSTSPATSEAVPEEARILFLDPHTLLPNPKQPRVKFNEEALEELAESLKRDGMQEPIIVRKTGRKYEIVSGERRVRAGIMAGLETVSAICRDVSDADMLKLGLIENIQREDLNAIELARAYQSLIDEFKWTQEQLASEIGKKRVTVTNMLRLLNLPEDVQDYVADGALTMGHARALLAIASAEGQRAAARKTIAQGLSVRETEKLAASPGKRLKPLPVRRDPNVVQIEDDLRRRLGAKVNIRTMKKNQGKIEIEYYNLDDLDRILSLLRGNG